MANKPNIARCQRSRLMSTFAEHAERWMSISVYAAHFDHIPDSRKMLDFDAHITHEKYAKVRYGLYLHKMSRKICNKWGKCVFCGVNRTLLTAKKCNLSAFIGGKKSSVSALNRRNDETLAVVTAEKSEKPQLLVGKNQRVQFYTAKSAVSCLCSSEKCASTAKSRCTFCNNLVLTWY
jgi:hypothetical protein